MRVGIIKSTVALGVALSVGAGFVWRYDYPFSLAWPGLLLALNGVAYAWIFSVAVILGLLAWLTRRAVSARWWKVVVIPAVISAGYCVVAFIYLARVPVPPPSATPYQTDEVNQALYLRAYDEGYRYGLIGSLRTLCFYPEVETQGFEDGIRAGGGVWYRFLGRKSTSRNRLK